jgi:hypothetical protein
VHTASQCSMYKFYCRIDSQQVLWLLLWCVQANVCVNPSSLALSRVLSWHYQRSGTSSSRC